MIKTSTSLAAMLALSGGIGGALYAMADEGGASGGDTSGDMGAIESETGFVSLAELAGVSTDDVVALTSRVPTAGVWHVRGETIKLSEGESRDPTKAAPFRIGYRYEVLYGKATDPNFDNEKMVGRKIQESFTIWRDQLDEGIGLTKGRFQKVGLPTVGHMGGVEGLEPGWLDGFVAFEFDLRIKHGTRNGDTVAYYDWLPPAATEEAA